MQTPSPETPTTFGRYQLIELIGEGAMAQVYRARRVGPVGFRKEVAIKRLRPGLVGRDESMRDALINEARNGGLLRHPGIVEIYEFDQADDDWYLAMELVRGWTLEEVLWRVASQEVPHPFVSESGAPGLSQRVVLDITRQIADALAHAHEATDETGTPLRLVHRDLKPANVFLDDRGVVKLADFGLAKSRINIRQTTDADRTKGSPLYMSPEQVAGEVVDGRSDLFALGTLIVEMSTGLAPFEGDSVANTLIRVLEVQWDAVEPEMARHAPVLLPIALRLLQKDVSLRYSSARALAHDLAALSGGAPIGENSRGLAGVLTQDATLTPLDDATAPPTARAARSALARSVIEAAPGGAWGLIGALGVLVAAIVVALVFILDVPGRTGEFAGVQESLPHSLSLAPAAHDVSPAAPATAPASAEASFTHAPPAAARLWQDLPLRVSPARPGIWDAHVEYRTVGASWRSVPLTTRPDGQLGAEIPVTSAIGLEYWIEVGSADGTPLWRYGSADAPVMVPVE